MRKDMFFFKVRIGADYSSGFDGLRTLVVAPHMICKVQCPFKGRCADSAAVRDMDTHCPVYAGLDPEVMCLSNANDIEVSAYINDEGAYPAYSAFTYYMLGKQDYLTKDDKERLWEAVAFTNYLQHLRPAEEPCDESLYEADYEAFKSAYTTIDPKPEVVYVWNQALCDCLKKHTDDFRYIGKADMAYALSVYIFVPTESHISSTALRRLKYRRGVKSERHQINWYKELVREHLGRYFECGKCGAVIGVNSLAKTLKDWVESGWLGADEEALYFRDTDTHRWTTRHIALLRQAIKERYGLKRGCGAAMAAMFSHPDMGEYPSPSSSTQGGDRLAQDIMHDFGKSLGNKQ